jgi:hypothetical protein
MYKHKTSGQIFEYKGIYKNFTDMNNNSNEVILCNVNTGSKEIVSLINLKRLFEKI